MIPLSAFPREGTVFQGGTLRVEALAHGVKRLVLDRPQVCNAFDAAMIRELSLAMAELAAIQDPAEMRLLVLEGEGPVFCSGADLAYMKEQGAAAQEQNLENARELGRMFTRLASFPAPVLCCVRGAAIGGGLGLAACSDFVLAEPAAVFATSEVMLGLVPAVIGPFVVRKLGLGGAAPLMLTGRRLRGTEALEAGLAQRLIDPGESAEEALSRVLREFLAAGPRAARATKELLRRITPLPDPELFEFTAHAIAAARMSAEGQEGLKAYFHKAPPPWRP
ncbi:enoyl-CoA hydratase-related protein [Mesoterricola silvestris]|uniref:Enoyl-CoA hydratase n=1 Tax=Mesoterricola silvestris TaxID=2927979 RepID=A0AA48K7L9_9BACT|nr:enoyl-CoA hydratase-related protein [Mesoterricola silvestris]BDU72019.1 enoyl-CoA hydratase [Mesoterricola silvestris]